MYTLQAFKEDTLASDITDSATSMILATGAFGTPTGEQMLVIDYDVAAKREIVKAAIDGTAVTSIDRAQDGTAAVAHSSGAKVIMAFVPSHYNDVTANGVLGYAGVEANQTNVSAEADLTSLSVTVTVPTGGRKVRITGFTNWISTSGTSGVSVRIKEGATVLGDATGLITTTYGLCLNPSVIVTPAAGSHTYKLSGVVNAGAACSMLASATSPAYILVEYLGGV